MLKDQKTLEKKQVDDQNPICANDSLKQFVFHYLVLPQMVPQNVRHKTWYVIQGPTKKNKTHTSGSPKLVSADNAKNDKTLR